MTYNVDLPGGTATVPDISGIPIYPKETVIVVPGAAIPGTTTIDVFAENLIAHNLYTVNYNFATGLIDNRLNDVNVYPEHLEGRQHRGP